MTPDSDLAFGVRTFHPELKKVRPCTALGRDPHAEAFHIAVPEHVPLPSAATLELLNSTVRQLGSLHTVLSRVSAISAIS
jgi:hypothetical protein